MDYKRSYVDWIFGLLCDEYNHPTGNTATKHKSNARTPIKRRDASKTPTSSIDDAQRKKSLTPRTIIVPFSSSCTRSTIIPQKRCGFRHLSNFQPKRTASGKATCTRRVGTRDCKRRNNQIKHTHRRHHPFPHEPHRDHPTCSLKKAVPDRTNSARLQVSDSGRTGASQKEITSSIIVAPPRAKAVSTRRLSSRGPSYRMRLCIDVPPAIIHRQHACACV
nr:uncharacterized protein LOC115266857 [Aedes albopictus]